MTTSIIMSIINLKQVSKKVVIVGYRLYTMSTQEMWILRLRMFIDEFIIILIYTKIRFMQKMFMVLLLEFKVAGCRCF